MPKSFVITHAVQITDTTDDDAVDKIESAYARHLGRNGFRDSFVKVRGATNTLQIGAKASELYTNSQRADRLLLGLNCAPPDKDQGTKDNARNDFYFAELGDDCFAGGTVNGLELSYLKGQIKSLFRLVTTNKLGSQFRSLEILPEHLVRFSRAASRNALIRSGELVEVRDLDSVVPDVPDASHVIQVDNFKNVKLFLSETDKKKLAPALRGTIAFGGESLGFDQINHELSETFGVAATHKLFDAPLGTNLVALNSSSTLPDGSPVPIIATIRKRPGESEPHYPVPEVGQRVQLAIAA